MLNKEKIEQMRQQLKAGVSVVSAPMLFPTPPDLAKTLVTMARIDANPKLTILEPSAGTGRILDALIKHYNPITAIELNISLANALRERYAEVNVIQGDFLGHQNSYDRIVMNPPFNDGRDITHIKHAYSLLNPGGILVSLCAGGPRQRKVFSDYTFLSQSITDLDYSSWQDLPPGVFTNEGTSVNTAIVFMRKKWAISTI